MIKLELETGSRADQDVRELLNPGKPGLIDITETYNPRTGHREMRFGDKVIVFDSFGYREVRYLDPRRTE